MLRQNPFEAENQALRQEMEGLQHQLREANQHLADYNSTRESREHSKISRRKCKTEGIVLNNAKRT